VKLFKELWKGKGEPKTPGEFKHFFDKFYPMFEMGV
jgi:hypothetical protein